MKRLALISVTDKSGIVEFANALLRNDFEILSTGGTAKHLLDNGIPVTSVSEYTGMPEILNGRVKTLHPKIHAGLLARPSDLKGDEDFRRIEVLVVNLYPFEKTVLSGASKEQCIENIDIGGPTMIRAAAKNAENVLVVVDPADYREVSENLENPCEKLRERLRAKAFAHTAYYDSLIAEYFRGDGDFPEILTFGFRLRQRLRYGENPHQKGGVYVRAFEPKGVIGANQVWGKELSYNNFLDADAAWELIWDVHRVFEMRKKPCVIVKHGNPCGLGWSEQPELSFQRAKEGDPISAFGGIVAFPFELDEKTASAITAKGNFFEVIICTRIVPEALNIFQHRSGWGQDVRILEAPEPESTSFLALRSMRGGALVQEYDSKDITEWRVVTEKSPTSEQSHTLRVAWAIVKHVKSNAITVCNSERLLGVGAGQMNRVQSVRLALESAGELAKGAVLASDAFFPFPDSIQEAAKAGIVAIIQPGGSKKDEEIIRVANEAGLAMVFTGMRHFKH
ncbi:MAG TPA: bifunctional phosphoribosylaminoimidazolecarboxamide formyltransferase/IMP cyclohydrolase [Fimbriimonadales bacterium]|nr:bifunctional phosphoribosylaminoimidazolecarboxamide formyltransferase/IMP cyclohydrolase [Fimbriimonadales bacterium]